MSKKTKEEDIVYKIAQRINEYDEDIDGCQWGHILEYVELAWRLGKDAGIDEGKKKPIKVDFKKKPTLKSVIR